MKANRRRQKRFISFFLVLIMAMGVMSCKVFKTIAMAGDSLSNAANINYIVTGE